MPSGFPDPENGKCEWPWVKNRKLIPAFMPDGFPWPKVSIVTPSYNQAAFLEDTIRSVLLQGYPNLEYIIIDGGSTDGSVDIIKKYEPWLTYWVSEKDRGQAHAINKGFEKATGFIGGWLNSDDLYLPGALQKIAVAFMTKTDGPSIVSGKTNVTDENLVVKRTYAIEEYSVENLIQFCIVPQASTFFSLPLFRQLGGLNEKLTMALDYDLWLRASNQTDIRVIKDELAIWRQHSQIKTVINNKQSVRESIWVIFKAYRKIPTSWIQLYWKGKIPTFRYNENKYKYLMSKYLYQACLKASIMFVKLCGWQA